jgi:hypothetical protein
MFWVLIYIATKFLAPIPLISLGINNFPFQFLPKSTNSSHRFSRKSPNRLKPALRPAKAGIPAIAGPRPAKAGPSWPAGQRHPTSSTQPTLHRCSAAPASIGLPPGGLALIRLRATYLLHPPPRSAPRHRPAPLDLHMRPPPYWTPTHRIAHLHRTPPGRAPLAPAASRHHAACLPCRFHSCTSHPCSIQQLLHRLAMTRSEIAGPETG